MLGASTWAFMGLGGSTRGGAHAGDGKELQSKMSVWELCGPLVLMIAAEHEVEGKQLRVMVDNIGAVYAYRKGWSNTCDIQPQAARNQSRTSRVLRKWLEKPTPDGELGTRIIQEMGRQGSDIGLVAKFV